jgi:hypothetical protein
MVPDPEPEVEDAAIKAAGRVSEPVSVPSERVIVKGAVTVAPARLPRLADPAKVPSPIFVSFAVPVAEIPVAVTDTVAVTVSVVFVVAARAATPIANPTARFLRVRFMCAYESSDPL